MGLLYRVFGSFPSTYDEFMEKTEKLANEVSSGKIEVHKRLHKRLCDPMLFPHVGPTETVWIEYKAMNKQGKEMVVLKERLGNRYVSYDNPFQKEDDFEKEAKGIASKRAAELGKYAEFEVKPDVIEHMGIIFI